MKEFPDTVAFTGADAPCRIECDIYDLEVIGDLPRELRGAWYRCGPDPQYPPHLGDDIYINGDGMVTLFTFENGHCDLKMRYVQTDRWKAERAARRSLFGKYRNSYTDLPEAAGLSRGTANTTPVWHGGRLLVLKEDHVPMQLDPQTLATLGPYTWDGKLRTKTVTAHPKIDPQTGEMFFFGYECEGDGSSSMSYCIANRQGELVHEEWFEAPYVAMVHDFAITQDYVIFPVMPTRMDPERLKAKGDHWKWDGSVPSYVGIMPRTGGASMLRWFKMPTVFAFHTINAFNIGSVVHLDMMASQRNAFPFIGDITGSLVNPEEGTPFATRWSFDLGSKAPDGEFRQRRLAPLPGELPVINKRMVGRPYRYSYIAMIDPSRRMIKEGPTTMGSNMIGKLDLEHATLSTYSGREESTFQEGHFIPTGSGEDEGLYVNIANHHDQNRSDLLVFDARAIEAGPIATVRIPIRLRVAFHTEWVAP